MLDRITIREDTLRQEQDRLHDEKQRHIKVCVCVCVRARERERERESDLKVYEP